MLCIRQQDKSKSDIPSCYLCVSRLLPRLSEIPYISDFSTSLCSKLLQSGGSFVNVVCPMTALALRRP